MKNPDVVDESDSGLRGRLEYFPGFLNRPIFVWTCNQTVRVWALEKVWRGVRGKFAGGVWGGGGHSREVWVRADNIYPPWFG